MTWPQSSRRATARRSRRRSAYAGGVTDTAVNVEVLPSDWQDQVLALAKERDAVILAHNYQVPEIQDIAHHVGDSLGLSRVAAEVQESTIVTSVESVTGRAPARVHDSRSQASYSTG